MMSPAGRRKVRKRKAQARNSGMKLTTITGIMFLAVFLGFITARFVIGPVIGYNADKSEIRQIDETDGMTEESSTEQETAASLPSEGYALQFGAFSTEEAAEELSELLESKGVKTEVVKAGDVYKVISPVTESREEALKELDNAKEKEITDVFIASF